MNQELNKSVLKNAFISIRGTIAYTAGVSKEDRKKLELKFRYKLLGAEFTDGYKNNTFDGFIYVFRDGRCNVGLVPDLIKELEGLGYRINFQDQRRLGSDINISLPSSKIKLRDYQEKIVREAIDKKYCCAEVATGGGKSLILAEYIARIRKKAIIIAPSIEIIRQLHDSMQYWFDAEIGLIGDSSFEIKDVTISTYQSLYKYADKIQDKLNEFDVLVIDEAQHIGHNHLRRIANTIPATYRLALSGTLFREDNADLEVIAAVGPKICSISYSDLIRQGYLVKPTIYIYRFPRKEYDSWYTYNQIYTDYIINNTDRNRVIVGVAEDYAKQNKKVLVFVRYIEHGMNIYNLFKDKNNVKFVYGNKHDRDNIVEDFENNKLNILISTQMLGEGWDCPPIDTLLLAAPSKSLIVTLQRIGRALRPYKDKNMATIIDTADNARYLWSHFQRRLRKYREEREWTIEKIINTSNTDDIGEKI